MKKSLFLTLLTITLCLSGCHLPAQQRAVDKSAGFVDREPGLYVSLMPAVREYFYYRKLAVISGSTDALYARFPALSQGMDNAKGINNEGFVVENFWGLQPIDGNILPEYYGRMQVKLAGDQAEVLLHGMELYLWKDEGGILDESGGEFKIILHVQRSDSGWEIIGTDEVTQAEWLDFSP